jgi:hypothetical protein
LQAGSSMIAVVNSAMMMVARSVCRCIGLRLLSRDEISLHLVSGPEVR